MDIDVRPLGPEDFDAMLAVAEAGFSEFVKAADRAQLERTIEWAGAFGAFDGPTLCGTASAYGFDLTVPGGASVPTSGVSGVSVLPTHRRRGILRSLMARQLDDVAERGEPVAVLPASEATIYGRFGYGVATEVRTVEVERARGRFVTPVADGLPTRLISKADATAKAPAWFDAHRRARPGELSRPHSWWREAFGEEETWKGGGSRFVVACEPTDGRDGGYAVYKVDHDVPDGAVPKSVLKVDALVAGDLEVRAALWRFLLDVDLVDKVVVSVPVDDDIRWRLVDWRACRETASEDFLWARVLDPAAALAGRRYPVADSLVLAIDDSFRPAMSACYRVEGGPDGALAEAVPEPSAGADLTLDISALGSLYLGGFAPSQLARVARLEGRTPDVLARADRFFSSGGLSPFCSTSF